MFICRLQLLLLYLEAGDGFVLIETGFLKVSRPEKVDERATIAVSGQDVVGFVAIQ